MRIHVVIVVLTGAVTLLNGLEFARANAPSGQGSLEQQMRRGQNQRVRRPGLEHRISLLIEQIDEGGKPKAEAILEVLKSASESGDYAVQLRGLLLAMSYRHNSDRWNQDERAKLKDVGSLWIQLATSVFAQPQTLLNSSLSVTQLEWMAEAADANRLPIVNELRARRDEKVKDSASLDAVWKGHLPDEQISLGRNSPTEYDSFREMFDERHGIEAVDFVIEMNRQGRDLAPLWEIYLNNSSHLHPFSAGDGNGHRLDALMMFMFAKEGLRELADPMPEREPERSQYLQAKAVFQRKYRISVTRRMVGMLDDYNQEREDRTGFRSLDPQFQTALARLFNDPEFELTRAESVYVFSKFLQMLPPPFLKLADKGAVEANVPEELVNERFARNLIGEPSLLIDVIQLIEPAGITLETVLAKAQFSPEESARFLFRHGKSLPAQRGSIARFLSENEKSHHEYLRILKRALETGQSDSIDMDMATKILERSSAAERESFDVAVKASLRRAAEPTAISDLQDAQVSNVATAHQSVSQVPQRSQAVPVSVPAKPAAENRWGFIGTLFRNWGKPQTCEDVFLKSR